MRHRTCSRRGAALIEFAVIALVAYLIIASILTFGSILWIGNGLQQAVDAGAQEIARMPFPPGAELGLGQINAARDPGWASEDADFKAKIYDETKLIIDLDDIPDGVTFAKYADENLPLINRLLIPYYIFDRNYGSNGVYRYPGAIVTNELSQTTVLIPLLRDDGLTWVAPVEEIRVSVIGIPGTTIGPFSVIQPPQAPANFEPGTVALRINYPYQSASMSGFEKKPPNEPNLGDPISADDLLFGDGDTGRYMLVVSANSYAENEQNIHSGRFGMGRQIALPYEHVREHGVRPFRKVISVQAIYRREVLRAPLP